MLDAAPADGMRCNQHMQPWFGWFVGHASACCTAVCAVLLASRPIGVEVVHVRGEEVSPVSLVVSRVQGMTENHPGVCGLLCHFQVALVAAVNNKQQAVEVLLLRGQWVVCDGALLVLGVVAIVKRL